MLLTLLLNEPWAKSKMNCNKSNHIKTWCTRWSLTSRNLRLCSLLLFTAFFETLLLLLWASCLPTTEWFGSRSVLCFLCLVGYFIITSPSTILERLLETPKKIDIMNYEGEQAVVQGYCKFLLLNERLQSECTSNHQEIFRWKVHQLLWMLLHFSECIIFNLLIRDDRRPIKSK